MQAEEILRNLQRLLHEHAAPGMAATPTGILSMMENSYGATATACGRQLRDLLHGSAAWELFERPVPGPAKQPLPVAPELSRCEGVLEVLRESGELAERERLLSDRNELLRDIAASDLGEPGRSARIGEVYDGYFAAVGALTGVYGPLYQEMRRVVGAIPPLTGARVRSRPILQPPLMAQLCRACHTHHDPGADPHPVVMAVSQSRRSTVRITATPVGAGLLDDRTWDIAAIAVCAFFVRTAGNDADASFPLLIDDYFDWRGVDPRKRTPEVRRQIDDRIRLLGVADDLRMTASTELWLSDPDTGRRGPTVVTTDGGFLRRRSALYRPTPWRSEVKNKPVFGHLVALGEWARPFLEARTMIGMFPRRLAEYDLGRQQWERRIGWYLTFQLQNQSSKMKLRSDADPTAGKKPEKITPQHPLRMRTVLENSAAPWVEMARTNPGKVIRHWIDTLGTLRHDGIIGEYECVDGAPDGSDLPVRNRLSAMLERRFAFLPGDEMLARLARRAVRRR